RQQLDATKDEALTATRQGFLDGQTWRKVQDLRRRRAELRQQLQAARDAADRSEVDYHTALIEPNADTRAPLTHRDEALAEQRAASGLGGEKWFRFVEAELHPLRTAGISVGYESDRLTINFVGGMHTFALTLFRTDPAGLHLGPTRPQVYDERSGRWLPAPG